MSQNISRDAQSRVTFAISQNFKIHTFKFTLDYGYCRHTL